MDSTVEHNDSLLVQDREPTNGRIHHDETSKVCCKRTSPRRNLLESDIKTPEHIGVATMEQNVLDSCKEKATCMEKKSELDDCSELSLQNMKEITIKPLICPSRLKQFDYQPKSIIRSSVVGESNIHRMQCRSRKERTVKQKSRYTNVTKRNCHTHQFTKSLPNIKTEVQIHKLCVEVELLNLKVSKQSCNSFFDKSTIKGSKIGVKVCLGTEDTHIEDRLSPNVADVRVEENVVANTDSNKQHTQTEVDNVLPNLPPAISQDTALEKRALSHHQDSLTLSQQELVRITAVSRQTRNNHSGASISADGQGTDGHVTDCSRAKSDESFSYKEVSVTSEKVSSSAKTQHTTPTSNNHGGAAILADGQGNDRRVTRARSYQNGISDPLTQFFEPYKKDSLTSESVSSSAEPELHSKRANKNNVVCSPPRNNLSADSNRISVINCGLTNFKSSEINGKLHIPNEQERANQRPVRKKGKHTHENPCNSDISSNDLRSLGSLKQHMPIRSSAHQYKCEHCDKCFSQKTHAVEHIRIHTGERPHECETCGKCFTQKTHLNVHMRSHTGVKPYKCETCGSGFKRKANLTIHMRTHTDENPYNCDTCGRSFKQMSNLTVHMRSHTGEKPYKCETCGRGFKRKANLTVHMRTHTGENPYNCDTCGRSFKQMINLTVHMRSHTGEKPYKCETCGRCFSQKNNLTYHMRIHTGEKLYECEYCEKCFSHKHHAIEHMTIHTSEWSYTCEICGASFRISGDLKSHMLIHSDENLFKCNICGKCFKRKDYLTIHMRIHTGENPYKCDICGRYFNTKCNFMRHMRIHTGEKPYKFETCGKSFSRQTYLKHHMQKQHTDKKRNGYNKY